jgi:peptidoglycan/xylan/chitin deacetylase (PgdA/CDA1 family)
MQRYSFQNHAYDESGFTPNCYNLATIKNDADKIEQVEKTQETLTKITGTTPKYFRFPGICHSDHDDQLIKNLGLIIDNATVVVGDPFNRNLNGMVDRVLTETQNGSVIIMHIGGKNAPRSLEVLKIIVPELRKRGFVFGLLD